MRKKLLFDADGTLWDFNASAWTAFENIFSQKGWEFNGDIFDRYEEINVKLWERYERGEMERARVLTERFDILFAELGIDFDGTTFDNMFREELEMNPVWMDGAEELLRKLRPDYKIYIVTNGVSSTQRKRIARSGLDRYMDEVFISDELGAQKPQKEFFDTVLSRIGNTSQDELLLIGDSLSADILGANTAGIPCVWFNPSGAPLTGAAHPDYEIHELKDLLPILG